MHKRHRPKALTRRPYTLLAALLVADGAWVSRQELADLLFESEVCLSKLSQYLWALDHFVGTVVERRHGIGYRLATLPPDEHLESMLACVPAVKRSDWWISRDCQIRMTA